MTPLEALRASAAYTKADRDHKADVAIKDDRLVCPTCDLPVHVWSPDFDSAEVRHGEMGDAS